MHVGVLPLLGSLAVGGPPDLPIPVRPPEQPASALGNPVPGPATTPPPATAPAMPFGPAPAYAPPQGPSRGGILPVPGMGPPGAVAAFGAIVPPPQMVHGPVMPVPAPVLAAKFLAPPGVRVTAYPGTNNSRMYDAPVVVGLRPGYVYRFELSNLPYNPVKTLYPEVEVHGSLIPRGNIKYMDYPIPLTFSLSDIQRALSGAVITKIVYLEDPEKAIPAEIPSDDPVEIPEDSERLAMKAARENGRVVAIVRLGDRKPPAEELRASAVEGTILLPGEKYLKAPVAPPWFPCLAIPLFDPILGPRIPKEECFPNGGDRKDPLAIGPQDKIAGLNPTDVGVEYTQGGRRKVVTSCMISICSPRFVIRRSEDLPTGFELRVGLRGAVAEVRPQGHIEKVVTAADIGREKPVEAIGRVRASGYVGQIGLSQFIGTTRPMAFAQVSGVKVEATYVEPVQLTAYPTLCPLTVTKEMDPPGPKQSGEMVTITIRYANTGTQAANDLVVNDSLSGRLEYVPGSAQSDRPANFSAANNEAGSVVVRWELPGTLLPGQSGTIKFKAKVR